MQNKLAFLSALTIAAVALPSLADENLKPPAQVTHTDHFDFAPGGTIRVDRSYGSLYVEGWDQPQVEITVTKFMPYDYEPQHPERATERLEAVHVVAERRSPTELEISTNLPSGRTLLSPWRHPINGDVRLEYEIRVPRNSKLAIQHGVGDVTVHGVTGDIQATCHRGDIVLWLPDPGSYSIDAKSQFGKVSSDFAGASLNQLLLGQKFTSVNPAPSQKLYLRVGFGGITLKPILPESETPASAR